MKDNRISVKERLTEDDGRVIIRTQFGDGSKKNTTVGHYIRETGYWMFVSNRDYKVTHWMSLPGPPKA
jgi:hypothetical protein